MEQANCKSRSEFLENAARMYAGYISANNALTYLPPILMSAVRGAVQDSENRIARLLFKQAVELDMVMNVVAGTMRVDEDTVKQLRATCIEKDDRKLLLRLVDMEDNLRGAATLHSFTCGYRLACGIHRELTEEPMYSFAKEEEERACRKAQEENNSPDDTPNQ